MHKPVDFKIYFINGPQKTTIHRPLQIIYNDIHYVFTFKISHLTHVEGKRHLLTKTNTRLLPTHYTLSYKQKTVFKMYIMILKTNDYLHETGK